MDLSDSNLGDDIILEDDISFGVGEYDSGEHELVFGDDMIVESPFDDVPEPFVYDEAGHYAVGEVSAQFDADPLATVDDDVVGAPGLSAADGLEGLVIKIEPLKTSFTDTLDFLLSLKDKFKD